jgi:hypothetical protein
MTDQWYRSQAREDWSRVRRRALWEAAVDVLTRRPGELLSLEEIRGRLNVRGSHYLGLQQVPLEKIVGSEGRYADFDRRFLPRKETTADRWMGISQASQKSISLPPVDLYKIGDIYFVKDGNHRISVARERGQADIDAYVMEYEVDVPLDPTFSMRDILLKEEYSDFLDWTGLARLRPEQRIELSALGGYLDLLNHINTHRYYLALERNGPVEAEEAVVSWYDNVYRPVVEAIRNHKILRFFPGRTEADLYLWIMQHRHYLRELGGIDPGAEAAVLDYASRFGQRSVLDSVGEAAQALAGAARAVASWSHAPPLELLDFLEWSQIDTVCPGLDIRLSRPAGYERLRRHLEEHQQNLEAFLQRPVARDEAIRDWCSHFYTPTMAAIRERGLLTDWPDHTEADLYMEILEHLDQHQASDGPVAPEEAVSTLEHHRDGDSRSHAGLLQGALRLLRRRRSS